MPMNILNGLPTDQLDVRHRALAYGDGLFETCRVENGQIRFWSEHRQRLNEGARRLQLNWASADQDQLEAELTAAMPADSGVWVCKILLLRQYPGRGYDFDPQQQRCDRLIQLSPYQPAAWQMSAARVVSSAVPASINPALAGLKHLNRLDSVLARQSARAAQVDEALLGLSDGCLVEGTMCNVFIKTGQHWQTPPLDQAGVNGIIRRRWMRLGQLTEANWQMTDLPQADAMLLGNALMGLVPVAEVDGQPLTLPSPDELAQLRNLIGIPSD
ncbi:aminodeoxychorismate lyase [Saccharospirillum mangrovi]|uniref:aminodeoxychorismate lyase n=1 Tax=Saccharospirillum mangrovi TaxID=2161747 RepID=UPI000D341F71|nr:aminodeoxychorismate lyase [Saccharospirillum mangrovi]